MSDATMTPHQPAASFSAAPAEVFPPAARKAWKTPKVIVGSMARANGAVISGTQPTDGVVSYIS